MHLIARSTALLIRSRPRFWLYLAGPLAVGLAWGASGVTDLHSFRVLALIGYFLLPANLYLYGVNDAFDAQIDRVNPKKTDRERRWTGDRVTTTAVLLCGLLGVGLLAVLPRIAWPWHLGFLALATVYSAPPRLKTIPPLDSLSNGLYILPGAVAYATATGQHPPIVAMVGGWCWTMAMHTFSAVPDIEPDREAGIRTTATVLGRDRALAYCAACWLAAAGAFALLDPGAGALLLVYPLLLLVIEAASISIDRAYWWYPAINAIIGAAFTVAGLWRVVHG
jgi:4-hydroxybenzoate polyprenyltransferase